MGLCPNCGANGFDLKKKDAECRECGFHNIETKELPPIDMIYCEGCGCHYSQKCSLHPESRQKPVK